MLKSIIVKTLSLRWGCIGAGNPQTYSSNIMENKNQKQADKEDKQESPYQELYGKKEGEDQEGNAMGTQPLDNAGAFGSAAIRPDSKDTQERPDPRHSEDGSDQDGEQRDAD